MHNGSMSMLVGAYLLIIEYTKLILKVLALTVQILNMILGMRKHTTKWYYGRSYGSIIVFDL